MKGARGKVHFVRESAGATSAKEQKKKTVRVVAIRADDAVLGKCIAASARKERKESGREIRMDGTSRGEQEEARGTRRCARRCKGDSKYII